MVTEGCIDEALASPSEERTDEPIAASIYAKTPKACADARLPCDTRRCPRRDAPQVPQALALEGARGATPKHTNRSWSNRAYFYDGHTLLARPMRADE